MRLIDADALNVYTIVRLVATGEQCENVIYAEDIDNAPTVDAEPKWIPCSERLPKKVGLYLVTVNGYVVMERWNGKVWWAFLPQAWMPLPKPYKMDGKEFEEPTINPCRGCDDYDGFGGCKSNGGCGKGEDNE